MAAKERSRLGEAEAKKFHAAMDAARVYALWEHWKML